MKILIEGKTGTQGTLNAKFTSATGCRATMRTVRIIPAMTTIATMRING